MNEARMEELLRRPPRAVVPAELAERLKEQIRLPRAVTGRATWLEANPWLRRWLPAVSLAALFFGCFVVAGVQSSIVSGLKRDNDALRTKVANLDQLRLANASLQRLQAQSEELERLRRDNAELAQLHVEAAQLRDQVQDAENLRAEAMKRQAGNAAWTSATNEGYAAFAATLDKAGMGACANNLKQIGLAARAWDMDHNGMEPTNYLSMASLVNNPRLLICPSDRLHTVAADWDHFTEENISYPIVSPGIAENIPNAVYAYCPVHHIYLLADGSVWVLTPEAVATHIKVVNGITTYIP